MGFAAVASAPPVSLSGFLLARPAFFCAGSSDFSGLSVYSMAECCLEHSLTVWNAKGMGTPFHSCSFSIDKATGSMPSPLVQASANSGGNAQSPGKGWLRNSLSLLIWSNYNIVLHLLQSTLAYSMEILSKERVLSYFILNWGVGLILPIQSTTNSYVIGASGTAVITQTGKRRWIMSE